MTRLALKIAAIVASLFVGSVWFALSFGVTPLVVLAAYTFLWVAIGNYLKTRSRPVPEPANDIAIAELIGEQERERRALADENRELRESLAAFVPVAYHLDERWHYADPQ